MCRELQDKLAQVVVQLEQAENNIFLLTTEVKYKSTVIKSMIDEHDSVIPNLKRRAQEREEVCSCLHGLPSPPRCAAAVQP